MATPETTRTPGRVGTHGRILIVDLSSKSSRVEEIDESVYRQFLGGYGLGAYLMWKHFPAGADPLAESMAADVVDTEVLPWLTVRRRF